jgi:putative protease
MTRPTLSLPVISAVSADVPDWHGFAPADPITDDSHRSFEEGAAAAPEPEAPQGDYATQPEVPTVPVPVVGNASRPVELLAPAGGPDAAFAAFQYGADAIYLGLKKFSARAEAENFTLDEVSEVVAYAHSLTPPRRVFVALNTLIRNDELPELIETLAALEDLGVDALIVQDLGTYALVRRHFPGLELHASTQLAVHNRAGAETLRQMGFQRVVLARELTLEEVHDITSTAGVETEVFIHGALCYAYSGLCLFSSQTLGRSGNRGKCAYSCRDSYTVADAPKTLRDGTPVKRDPSSGFPFSMKDLALPDHLPALRAAGVSCFKIEGRKKSPLYVATATEFYRRLIDGTLDERERAQRESDLQSAFGRPWTRLFIDSHKDKEVADRDTVGHRGAIIGRVESVERDRKSRRLRFRTARAIEKYDGVQIDLPVLGKPFGFGLRRIWVLEGGQRRPVIQAPAGSLVEVELPQDHRDEPELPRGALVYCASSNAVKRTYQHERPKPGLYRSRRPVSFELTVTSESLSAVARCGNVEVRQQLLGPFEPAREPHTTAQAARVAFEKLGDTGLQLCEFICHNPAGLFVPVSRLNGLRRELTAQLEAALARSRRERVESIIARECPTPAPTQSTSFRWNIKVDRIGFVEAFTAEDWADVDEVVIDIARDHPALLAERLAQLAEQLGRDRIRLALPALTRKWEERGLLLKLHKLRAAGWHRWEAANMSAWSYLGLDPLSADTGSVDLATDWSVYALNRVAIRQLQAMGVRRFALSPEDGLANLRPTLAEFGSAAVLIVYQDTPLFMAESCAYANLIGGCPGKANCSFDQMNMVSSHGERVTAIDYHCRTIVLNQGPFCLSSRLRELAQAGAVSLRADFIYRKYDATVVRQRWRAIRAGRAVPGGHAANFDRGVL